MFCLTVDYDHDSWVAGLMGPREVAIAKAIGNMPKMFVGLIMFNPQIFVQYSYIPLNPQIPSKSGKTSREKKHPVI